MKILQDERSELYRIIKGGAYDESFWRRKWEAGRGPDLEAELQAELRGIPQDSVESRREARKIVKKLKKLAGKKRAFTQAGYAQNWSAEQKRIDNLQHAAVYLHRANVDFHFYA